MSGASVNVEQKMMLAKASQQFSKWEGVCSYFKVDDDNSMNICMPLYREQSGFAYILKLRLRKMNPLS